MKNEKSFENEYITGTPDVLVNGEILDTKCSWNGKTFLDSITDELNTDYEWQIRGYMDLTGYSKGRVCYCLMDTPDFVNYGNAVSYSAVPNKARYFEFTVDYDDEKNTAIIEKVRKCREWLSEYDKLVSSLLS